MTIAVILGVQWGDEGKGKLTDILTQEAQLCCRAAGGHNAGHSIKANGISYDFHLLPSGLMNPKCMNFIGSGVVFHVPTFFSELKQLEEKGLVDVHNRILVSDRVNVLLDLHIVADGLREKKLAGLAIGTTKRGIGPAYATSRERSGIKLNEIFDDSEAFEKKVKDLASDYSDRYGRLFTDEYDINAELARFAEYRETMRKYVVEGTAFMESAQQQKDMKIVVEGANALMLDIDYGSYPYVTSSSTTFAGIMSGLCLNPDIKTERIGVVKAYTTRVGAGAFKTEDTGEIGTKLQEIGREWGTSTGRRRRCGWLDLVVVKYSRSINYYTSFNLTKLDILDTFETIKIAIAYRVDGKDLVTYPASLKTLDQAEVIYHEMPGWQIPTTNIKTYQELPQKARDYVEYIEKFVGIKIKYIGTGPDREAMIQCF